MMNILFVDDDAVVVEIYRKKLLHFGYEVVVAEDGLAAMKLLHTLRPHLVVLDIMMPKFSGLEVLDFIRAKPELAATKVVVLSNYYISSEQHAAIAAKADGTFIKSSCTPMKLLAAISTLLPGAASAPTTPPPAKPVAPPPAPAITAAAESGAEGAAKARQEFFQKAPQTLATLRQLNEAFIHAGKPLARARHLFDFYRKVHYVTAMAGMAGCSPIALLANAFEAMLLELHEKPDQISCSTSQTIAFTLDFLALLFKNLKDQPDSLRVGSAALVVDDDPISLRAMSMALRRANLEVTGAPDATTALHLLAETDFHLIFLDVLLPDMDGMELCRKLRTLPKYRRTPIIFVTGHADFQKRAQSILSGGNDLIAKPIFPIEMAVKAVTHLLRSELPEDLARG
jgi:CheY-like chemotaxis protein